MELKEIADELVAGCRENRTTENLGKLYDAKAVSVEGMDYDGSGREVSGLEAIRGKHAWWDSSFEVHDAKVEGPFLHGEDRFGVVFEIDATNKENGERMQMRELGIYQVKGGKIVREEFFY
ncbi:nuclear transport factor 2 family protein [Thalassococcus sp. CAU 1522]|uniref:Nuclear transport factor 2 family protein n=1 Tax=Thalassococcus arenae TaxID=2851652 RepID=A0ABS6N9P4_9RHOB|nr:nuclear transport factor 2 family protein [Thalassococcus arenae]MBV2360734.1 nuclear transport factor 2 family protein [Thalassococcus arenae]